jgi:mycothiol synthase
MQPASTPSADRAWQAGQNGRVETLSRLSPAQVEEVRELVDAASEVDGVRPLSEHVFLHLRYGGDTAARNLLLRTPDRRLAGYAHLDVTDEVEGGSAELAVAPDLRGRGYGRALVTALLEQAPERGLRLWAHGEHPAARRLAEGMGFTRIRSLWQMRRSLFAPLPAIPSPDGVTIRTFRPGPDDAPWLELNARAFASHPEQGSWTIDDLHRRMQEPWFDPVGFFLAEREGRLVGFHWTKVHGGEASAAAAADSGGHGHEAIGEVYVLGIDPNAQGLGLGRVLTATGLRYLRGRGLTEAMLYVEGDNAPAIRLYEGMGFTHWDTDVMYRWRP